MADEVAIESDCTALATVKTLWSVCLSLHMLTKRRLLSMQYFTHKIFLTKNL